MWIQKLEQIIRNQKIKIQDVAETAGLTRQGLHRALNKNTLRFESAICIMTKFNIDYYELIEMENPFTNESFSSKEVTCTNIKEIHSLIDKTKDFYEEQISQEREKNNILKDHNTALNNQVI